MTMLAVTIVLLNSVVPEKAEKRDRGAGMMSRRTAARLAWTLCALSLALTALSLLLLVLGLSHLNTYIYIP